MLDASAIKKRFNSTPLAKVVSSIIVKNSRVFITFEINSPNEQSMLEEETRSILQDIPKDSVHFIFTNKDLNAPKPKLLINNVKNIILVSSGKGGVGKSTIALALAKKYKNAGYKVGILDADIYGPSIPRMLSIDQKPIIANGKFIPIESDGILVISAGLLVEKDVSMAWRGPMISKILYQMLSSTVGKI
jgi:ATP-binding protein involved in chromosome partitioning